MNIRRLLPFLAASAVAESQLSFRATVNMTAAQAEGESGEGPKMPTFAIDAYDGGILELGFWGPSVVDLSGVRARKNIKIFREHDPGRVVGHATKVSIDGEGIRVDAVGSGSPHEVADIIATNGNGFPWDASIGARLKRREYVEAGKSVVVNGRTFKGPLLVARAIELVEVSFVAVGASANTSISIAAGHNSNAQEHDMTFEQWLRANGYNRKKLTPTKLRHLKAAYDAEMAEAEDPQTDDIAGSISDDVEDTLDDDVLDTTGRVVNASRQRQQRTTSARSNPGRRQDAQTDTVNDGVLSIRAEYARVANIQRICATHDNPKITVDKVEVDLEAHAIAEGWDVKQTELEALRAAKPRGPYASSGSGNSMPVKVGVIEASMCLSAGCDEDYVAKHYGADTVNAAMESDNRGIGLQELIFASLAQAGYHHRPGRMDNNTIKAALELDPALNGRHRTDMRAAGGGFSIVSVSNILSNVANKTMLERFETAQSVVPDICYESEANDFKAQTSYRLDSSGTFQEVGPDGELKHISLQDTQYSIALKTHGGIIALTRQMIVNDDLGAFMQIPMLFVEAAIVAREQLVFTKLLANAGTFFGTGNKNYISGADTVFGIEGLNLAVKAFRNLKNKGNAPILSRPTKVLVTPSDEATALQLFKSTDLNETTTANKGKGTKNIHAGMFEPVVSPYLGTDFAISGASDTAWYMLPDPKSGRSALQVKYLAGTGRRPAIESAQANFNVLGIQWRSYWDFMAELFDEKAWIKSKGAA